MIDVKRMVYTPIAEKLREIFPKINVSSEYTNTPATFPFVYINETDNYVTREALDSALNEKYATVVYEISAYSNKASGRETECRTIMNEIDTMMHRQNFTRLSISSIPNMGDATIYRIVARYRAVTDGVLFYRG